MSHFDTKDYGYVEANNYTDANRGEGDVRVIVIHDMEYDERSDAAERVANYFANTDRNASAHYCVDNDSIVQCVWDSDVAWAAPGCNHDGIQIELTGYARQSREEWLDEFGKQMLDRAADLTAQLILKFHLNPKHLTNDELRAGHSGVVGHNQVSEVYKKSSHWDPGPNFPWDYFMELVNKYVRHYENDEPKPEPKPEKPHYDVVTSAVTDVDQILAFTLGADNLFKFVKADELDKFDIDYVVAVGYKGQELVDKVGDGVVIAGASRYATANKVLEALNRENPDRSRPWSDF